MIKNQSILPTSSIYFDIFNATTQLIALLDTDLTILDVNQIVLEYTGLEKERILKMPYWDLPIWQHSEFMQNKLIFSMEHAFAGEVVYFEATHYDKNNTLRYVDCMLKPLYNSVGEVTSFLAQTYDITDLIHVRQTLSQTQRELDTFFDYSNDGYLFNFLDQPIYWNKQTETPELIETIISNQRIMRTNFTAQQLFERTPEEFLQASFGELLNLPQTTLNSLWSTLLNKGICSIEHEITRKESGAKVILLTTLIAFIDDVGRFAGNFAIHRNMTDRKNLENRLRVLATTDFLTGARNRRSYLGAAELSFVRAKKTNTPLFVLMMDIDNFKAINDTYGHDIGDEVLKSLSKTTQAFLGPDKLFGRMGGEEFSATFNARNLEEAYSIANQLRLALGKIETTAASESFTFTISIGLSQLGQNIQQFEHLLQRADIALYHAKRHGKNRVVIYDSSQKMDLTEK